MPALSHATTSGDANRGLCARCEGTRKKNFPDLTYTFAIRFQIAEMGPFCARKRGDCARFGTGNRVLCAFLKKGAIFVCPDIIRTSKLVHTCARSPTGETVCPRVPTHKKAGQDSCPDLRLRGGDKGVRTPDLMTASHALSQLSYIPEKWWAMLDSNQRPHPCEGCALPLSQSPISVHRLAQRESYTSMTLDAKSRTFFQNFETHS